jgi:hypothetical protein
MSAFLVAVFFAIGVGGWTYTQLARRSGNANPSSTLMAAGGAALLVFIFAFTLLKFVFNIG